MAKGNRVLVPGFVNPGEGESRGSEVEPEHFERGADERERDDELPADPEVDSIAELSQAESADMKWQVWRMRTKEEMERDPRASQRAFVANIIGSIDFADLKARFGGGVFELWGYYGGRLRTRKRVPIEGAPKSALEPEPTATPAAASAAAPVVVNSMEQFATKLLERIAAMEAKVTQLATAPAAPVQNFDLHDLVELAKSMQPRESNVDVGAVMTQVMSAVQAGISLKSAVEGGGEKRDIAEIVVEKAVPAVERLATAILTQRRMPMRAAPPVARPGAVQAEAQVITPDSPASDAPAIGIEQVRMMAAMDALARAAESGTDPDSLAGTLSDLLSDQQLAWLHQTPEDQVLGIIATQAGAEYPVLGTEAGQQYLRAVLGELKRPQDDGEGGSPPAP